MKRALLAIAVSIVAVTISTGFAASKNEEAGAPQALPPVKAVAQEDATLSGKVVETMNAGGYTYVRIEKNGKKTWVAVPPTELKVGQKVTFYPGTDMGRFTSKTLNKTFDHIIFSPGMVAEGGASAGVHGAKKAAAPVSTENIKVEKAAGPDAFTVSEVHAKAGELDKKTAVVRGKVVKVSEAIMGKNWIHIQDGTGDVSTGSNKLVVTSQDLPAVGDVVTMKGVIYKDKDFGAGYRYSVIMEEAAIQH